MYSAFNDEALKQINNNITAIENFINKSPENLEIKNFSGGAAKCQLSVKCSSDNNEPPTFADYDLFWSKHLRDIKKDNDIKDAQIKLLKAIIEYLEQINTKTKLVKTSSDNIKRDINNVNNRLRALQDK
tara:strand:+ start:6079 stop:6465 length:387 start_codon:yes stop_codon:yes gene_type:complete